MSESIAASVPMAGVEPPSSRRGYWGQVIHDTLSWRSARLGLLWIGVVAFFGAFAPLIASSHPLLMKTSDGRISSPLLRHLSGLDVSILLFAVLVILALAWPRLRRDAAALLVAAALIPAALFLAAQHGPRVLSLGLFRPEATAGAGMVIGWAFCLFVHALVAAAWCLLAVVGWACARRLWHARGGALPVWLLSIAVAGMTAALLFVRPPMLAFYERYREMEQRGQIAWAVRTIVPYSASDRLRDMPERRLTPPSRRHWMGTDLNGADVLARMIHACRIALSIGFIATGISVTIGIFVGGLMGYYAGRVDLIGMRLIEIFETVPRLMLLMAITALVGRNLYLMMAVIGLTAWPGNARFIRAEFLRLRNQDFVQAAIACGLPLRAVLLKHLLPNGVSPILVSASFGVASAILVEATLSFLGLGLIEDPSWGQMLNQARSGGRGFVPWLATFPGLAIFLTVFAYTLIGEAMRDALDPKLRKRE